jgi:plasmid maintenance system antidote protein VapI
MAKARDATTIGSLVKEAIDEGCRRLKITRGELADRLGVHRVSLYNLLNRPGGISLETLDRLMGELDLSTEHRALLVYKWSEGRAQSNPLAALLFPVLRSIAKENGIEPQEVGARILATFRKLSRERS